MLKKVSSILLLSLLLLVVVCCCLFVCLFHYLTLIFFFSFCFPPLLPPIRFKHAELIQSTVRGGVGGEGSSETADAAMMSGGNPTEKVDMQAKASSGVSSGVDRALEILNMVKNGGEDVDKNKISEMLNSQIASTQSVDCSRFASAKKTYSAMQRKFDAAATEKQCYACVSYVMQLESTSADHSNLNGEKKVKIDKSVPMAEVVSDKVVSGGDGGGDGSGSNVGEETLLLEKKMDTQKKAHNLPMSTKPLQPIDLLKQRLENINKEAMLHLNTSLLSSKIKKMKSGASTTTVTTMFHPNVKKKDTLWEQVKKVETKGTVEEIGDETTTSKSLLLETQEENQVDQDQDKYERQIKNDK